MSILLPNDSPRDTEGNLRVFHSQKLLAIKHIDHGFFSRLGGVSSGKYAELNCGYNSLDARDKVRTNRRRVAHHMGVSENKLITCRQIHSNICHIIEKNDGLQTLPCADAIVTNISSLAISVLSADCGNLLFADTKKPIIGIAHAGWKGALGSIVDKVIIAMQSLGSRSQNIVIALGATICQSCYEVDKLFYDKFLQADQVLDRFFKNGKDKKHFQFDLPAYIGNQARKHGAVFEDLRLCTYHKPELFFSHRYNKHHKNYDYGRQISVIKLLNDDLS